MSVDPDEVIEGTVIGAAEPTSALAPVPEQPPFELTPGYHECIAATDPWTPGDLVFAVGEDGGKVLVLQGTTRWRVPVGTFRRCFVAAPDGAIRKAAEMASVLSDVGSLQARVAERTAQLRGFDPHVGAGGQLEGTDGQGGALVAPGPASAEAAKRAVAQLRNEAALMRLELESKAGLVRAFADEQRAILESQMGDLKELLAKATEAVWTVNLYLGTNEEIVQLADGEPAAADETIVIRQLVLYMDEEAQVALEEGGIDARNIEDFDAWVTASTAHLDQLLPEPRGIVALRPRRNTKQVSDGWLQAQLEQADKATYFLIRNGGRVYRMWTDYQVRERLVPASDEWERVFEDREYDWTTRTYKRVPLRPGSDAFMRAEKKADADRRHYMRMALILQGLIDRTPVFHPLARTIDVSDPAAFEGPIRIVLDGDAMLSDGRERFRDWQRRVNGALDVGHRIVGAFDAWGEGLRIHSLERSGGNDRLSPRHASFPSSIEVHTITGRDGRAFTFQYERRNEWQDYQRRATCRIEPDDRFIIDIDALEPADVRYWLGSRLDRQDYLFLVPVMRLALRLREQEEAAEAPFRDLLTWDIAKRHGIDHDRAAAMVPELVRWWKLSTRTHRALASDDAKAHRMIVAEAGHRLAAAAALATGQAEGEAVVASVRAAEPDVLLVAHARDRQYIALIAANDEDVFVHEQRWTPAGRRETREWRTVDARAARWTPLWTAPRFEGWKRNPSLGIHLTDPEQLALVEEAAVRLRMMRSPLVPLAAIVDRDGQLMVWSTDMAAKVDAERPLTGDIRGPSCVAHTLHWKRDASRRPVLAWSDWGSSYNRDYLPGHADAYPHKRIIWRDKAAVAAYEAEIERAAAAQRARKPATDRVSRILALLNRAATDAREAAARARFDADYGDPALWPAHRKTLRIQEGLVAHPFEPILRLIERGIDPTGMTLREVVDAWQVEHEHRHLQLREDVEGLVIPQVE